MPMMIAMNEGRVRGMFAMGQNPAVGGQNARYQRMALGKLDWLVVKDNFETETAAFWYKAPEVVDGSIRTEDIQTEVFFFPSAQVAEMDGTFTNTQRLIKYHHKAVDPPGDARSDIWFTYHLGKRLKTLYEGSTEARDQGLLNLVWDYEPDPEEVEPWQIKDEPSALKIMREINGYVSGKPEEHLPGFAALKDDGSTTCASWIYSGIYPKPGIENLKAASRVPDAEGPGAANLRLGLRLAGQPAHHLQPRLGPAGRHPLVRGESLGLLGPGQGQPGDGRARHVDRRRRARLRRRQGAGRRSRSGRHRPRRPERHRPLHHEGGRQGVALHPDRSRRRPLPDALRAGRVARAERPLPDPAELAGAARPGTSMATRRPSRRIRPSPTC